ncbi:MAG: Rdx family protein [Planctomycetota bacterium]
MPTAASLAAAIEAAHPGATVEKKPGGRGDFIVTADGREVWNKKRHAEQRFPEHDEVLAQLG